MNAHGELPSLHSMGYASSTVDMTNGLGALSRRVSSSPFNANNAIAQLLKDAVPLPSHSTTKEEKPMPNTNARRYVQVMIIDPDENVPVDQAALHVGQPFLTDLTDQELFFEVDIKAILESHNKKRVAIRDKKASETAGREVWLEPARVRDLRMNVTIIASFA